MEYYGDLDVKSDLEIFVGTDNIIRLNADGTCVLRLRLGPDAKLLLTGPGQMAAYAPSHGIYSDPDGTT